MPEIKNTFVSGRMNKDLDERLVPNNEYIDALNVDGISSRKDNAGTLQNSYGNFNTSSIGQYILGAKVIGSHTDKENDKMYWFISGTNVDAIAEYDPVTEKTEPVLVDYYNEQEYNTSALLSTGHAMRNFRNASANLGPGRLDQSTTFGSFSGYAITHYGDADDMFGLDLNSGRLESLGTATTNGTKLHFDFTESTTELHEGVDGTLKNAGTNDANWTTAVSGSAAFVSGDTEYPQDSGIIAMTIQLDTAGDTASLKLRDSKELNTDLTVNSIYKITFDTIAQAERFTWRVDNGDGTSATYPHNPAGSYVSPVISDTDWTTVTIVFTAQHATDCQLTVTALENNTKLYVKNISLKELTPVADAFRKGSNYEMTYTVSQAPTQTPHDFSEDVYINEMGPDSSNVHLITTVGTHTVGWKQGQDKNGIELKHGSSYGVRITEIKINQVEKYLNFDPNKLITAINILDGMLFWTDNNSEPKKIHVDKCKAGAYSRLNAANVEKNWNYNTKKIDYLGNDVGNIVEEDITVIKQYPLQAPSMLLSATSTKPLGKVLKTNCTTPLNTSFDYQNIYQRGNDEGDGTGDSIVYLGFNYGYLYNSIVYYDPSASPIGDYYKPQAQVGVGQDWDHGVIDWASITNGSTIKRPIHRRSPDRVFEFDRTYQFEPQNDFTLSSDYEKESYNVWASLHDYMHLQIVKPTGERLSISGGCLKKDLYGSMLNLHPKVNQAIAHAYNTSSTRFGLKGDMLIIYRWFYNNNESFWTYKDGDDNEKVKPPGTGLLPAQTVDLTDVKDQLPNIYTPYTPDKQEKAFSDNADFGEGWEVRDGSGTYDGIDYTQRKVYYGDAATTVAAAGGNHGFNVNQNGYQYLQRVSTGFLAKLPYFIKVKVKLIHLPSPSSGRSPFGISQYDHNGELKWVPNTDTDSVVQVGQNSNTTNYGWRLGPNSTLTGGPNGDGIYTIGGNITCQNKDNSSDLWNWKEHEVSVNFFKDNGAIVEILDVEFNSIYSNPVRIQELVFQPRPDYEVGDIIKMTNTTKSNNGNDITVTVKLISENTRHDSLTNTEQKRPLTWKDAHTVLYNGEYPTGLPQYGESAPGAGDGSYLTNSHGGTQYNLCLDPTFSSPSGVWTAGTNWSIGGSPARAAHTAGATGSLQLNVSGYTSPVHGDTGIKAGRRYLLYYEVVEKTSVPDPSNGGGYLYADNYYYDNYNNSTNSYEMILPHHGAHGNERHVAVWTANADATVFTIHASSQWVGKIDNFQMMELKDNDVDPGPEGSSANRKIFQPQIVSIDEGLLELTDEQKRHWTCELQEPDPLYEFKFPRFAYRWKYEGGEYSPISAFTEPAFLPDDEYNYSPKDGYNVSMTNQVRRILLNNFQRAPHDVIEVDILYKESDSNNIYTVTTVKSADLDDLYTNGYEITKEQTHALIESKQMLRPYDNVPRRAKAQEITANRLVYGNYTQQYDVPANNIPSIQSILVNNNIDSNNPFGKSVKSIRSYQVGLSFLDKFGRQSPIFSNKDSIITIPQLNSVNANLIQSKIINNPPDWVTHYKFFVKDSANEYYNISLDRFYQSENESHFWLSFSSSDINKVQEDDYLILKKTHDVNTGVTPARTLKYKVIAKQGSPPDFLRIARQRIGGRIDSSGTNSDSVSFSNLSTHAITGDGLQFASQSSYGGSAAGYPQVNKTTFRLRGDIVDANDAFKQALLQNQADRYIRIGKSSSGRNNTLSNYYEVLSVTRVDGDNSLGYGDAGDYYEFTLLKPLGPDASFVDSAYSISKNLFLEYYGQDFLAYDSSFEGKFFVKVIKDADLNFHVARKQTVTDASLNIVNTQETNWAFIYENNENINLNADRGQDTDDFLTSKENFLWDFTAPGLNTNYNTTSKYRIASLQRPHPGSTLCASWHGEVLDYHDDDGSNVVFDTVNGATSSSATLVVDDASDITVGMFIINVSSGSIANNTPPEIMTISGNSLTLSQPQSFGDGVLLTFSKGISMEMTGTNQTPNPFTRTWKGTIGRADYAAGGDADELTQRFVIDQAWAWYWGDQEENRLHYPGQNAVVENVRLGPGFVTGNKYCAFRFIGLGNVDFGDDGVAGGSGANEDTNTFFDGTDKKISVDHFDNYNLAKQLTTAGTKFRWSDDPTQTIYTIVSTFHKNVSNYKIQNVDNASARDLERANYGYRIYIQLDKNIVWSPTSTIVAGFANNEGGAHSPLTPYGDGRLSTSTGSTSRLEILEYKPSETTYESDNPTVFEIEPKKTTDLNLYYETANTNMILKSGMFIEALNNINVNDSPNGNYNNIEDAGTVYAPSGTPYLAYNNNNTPKRTIIKTSNNNPNEFFINPDSSAYAFDLPAGVTIRISKRDENGVVEYYRDYLLPEDVNLQTGKTSANQDVIIFQEESLLWHNCYSFGNGVESDRIRDDFNAITIDKGPRVSTTLEEKYNSEIKSNGLIYSGIYNSMTDVNKLNEFIAAEKITKDLNPEYGSIQKLFTRNTNVIAFCEDKILKILANKDALFNADGNSQLLSTNRVLGSSVPFLGEYGISKNPESFANYGYRIYFTDQARGAVLRLSADGLTPISDKGLSSYFMSNLSSVGDIIGSYDEASDAYNLTLGSETIGFSEKAGGWTSFRSFLPESAVSLNGKYYTYKNGDIWRHSSTAIRNNYYGIQYQSSVKFVFNGDPSTIKNFNTINYEGTQSREYSAHSENNLIKKGWYTNSIETDKQSGKVKLFKEKEGKWFNNIIGLEATELNIDTAEFTSQGLGVVSSIDPREISSTQSLLLGTTSLGYLGYHPNYKTLTYKGVVGTSNSNVAFGLNGKFSSRLGPGGAYHYQNPTNVAYVTDEESADPSGTTKIVLRNNTSFGTSGTAQEWIQILNYHDNLNEFFYISDIFTELVEGHTYYIEALVLNAQINAQVLNASFIGFGQGLSDSGVLAGFSSTNNEYILAEQMLYDQNVDHAGGADLVVNGDLEASSTAGTIPELARNFDFTERQSVYSTNAVNYDPHRVAFKEPQYSNYWTYGGQDRANAYFDDIWPVNNSGGPANWMTELGIGANHPGEPKDVYFEYGTHSALYGNNQYGAGIWVQLSTSSDPTVGTDPFDVNHSNERILPLVYDQQLSLDDQRFYQIEVNLKMNNTANSEEAWSTGLDVGIGSQYFRQWFSNDSTQRLGHGGSGGRYTDYWGGDGDTQGQATIRYDASASGVTTSLSKDYLWFAAYNPVATTAAPPYTAAVKSWQFGGFELFRLDHNNHWSCNGAWELKMTTQSDGTNNRGNSAEPDNSRKNGLIVFRQNQDAGAGNNTIIQTNMLTNANTVHTVEIDFKDTIGDSLRGFDVYLGNTLVHSYRGTNGHGNQLLTFSASNDTGLDFKIVEIANGGANWKGFIRSISVAEGLVVSNSVFSVTGWTFGNGWLYTEDANANHVAEASAATSTNDYCIATTTQYLAPGEYTVTWDQVTTNGGVRVEIYDESNPSNLTQVVANASGTNQKNITITIPNNHQYNRVRFFPSPGSSNQFEGTIDNLSIFSTLSNEWTLGSGWSVANQMLVSAGGNSDGCATSDLDYTLVTDRLGNQVSNGTYGVLTERVYEVRFEIIDRTAGIVFPKIGGHSTAPSLTGSYHDYDTNGVHVAVIKVPANASESNYATQVSFVSSSNSNFVGKIDNIRVKMIAPDWNIVRESGNYGGWDVIDQTNQVSSNEKVANPNFSSDTSWDHSVTYDPDNAWSITGGNAVKINAGSSNSSIKSEDIYLNTVAGNSLYKVKLENVSITNGRFRVWYQRLGYPYDPWKKISHGYMTQANGSTYEYALKTYAYQTNGTSYAFEIRDESSTPGSGTGTFGSFSINRYNPYRLTGTGNLQKLQIHTGSSASATNNATYSLAGYQDEPLTIGVTYRLTLDYNKTSGEFKIVNEDDTTEYAHVTTAHDPIGNQYEVIFTATNNGGLSFKTEQGSPFVGHIKNIDIDEVNYTSSGIDPGTPIVGFSTANMIDIVNSNDLTRGGNGSISAEFKFSRDTSGYPFNPGISFYKGDGIKADIGNFTITDTTISTVGSTEKWIVNNSETDRNITTDAISENYIVGSSVEIEENLYIHSKTVEGVKYAVKAANFLVVIADLTAVVVKTDLGVVGTYGNVVKINITRSYNQGDPFPDDNKQTFVTVTETGDGIILATDQ